MGTHGNPYVPPVFYVDVHGLENSNDAYQFEEGVYTRRGRRIIGRHGGDYQGVLPKWHAEARLPGGSKKGMAGSRRRDQKTP